MLVNIQSTRGNQVTKLYPIHRHTKHASSSVSWPGVQLYFTLAIRVGRHVDFLFVKDAAHTHTHTHTHTSSHPVLAGAREQLGYRLAGLPATAYSREGWGQPPNYHVRPLNTPTDVVLLLLQKLYTNIKHIHKCLHNRHKHNSHTTKSSPNEQPPKYPAPHTLGFRPMVLLSRSLAARVQNIDRFLCMRSRDLSRRHGMLRNARAL